MSSDIGCHMVGFQNTDDAQGLAQRHCTHSGESLSQMTTRC